MKKTKTNISVVNNAGIRRNASVHVGKQGPFPSGDILDANAIQEMLDDDSLAVSAALNDLNSRVGSGGGIGEDEELIISTALNDLNSRIDAISNNSGNDFITCEYDGVIFANAAIIEDLSSYTFRLNSGRPGKWRLHMPNTSGSAWSENSTSYQLSNDDVQYYMDNASKNYGLVQCECNGIRYSFVLNAVITA